MARASAAPAARNSSGSYLEPTHASHRSRNPRVLEGCQHSALAAARCSTSQREGSSGQAVGRSGEGESMAEGMAASPELEGLSCDVESLCFNLLDGQWWGVGLELLVLAYAFVGVAIVADAHLVPGLETLCVRWGIPEDVAGASFMAFGSAAPEITINAISTIKAVLSGAGPEDDAGDDAALGVGAILGSGMIAFTAIPGFCGLFAGRTLELEPPSPNPDLTLTPTLS